MTNLERIRKYLADGIAEWRNETDPEPAERYARTAAKLESLLREVSDGDDDAEDRFAVAEALYCISGDFHSGQASPLYAVGGVLESHPIWFRPSPIGNGPDSDGARRIYRYFRAHHRRNPSGAEGFAERAAVILAIVCTDADDDETDDDETDGGDE